MAKHVGYVTELKRDWWLKNRFFTLYMLREATVLPLVFFIGCLLAGLYCLLQGQESWLAWRHFMQSPLTIAVNLLAFFASLFHAWTFFQLFPRVMPLRVGERAVPAKIVILAQWLGVIMVVGLFAWVFGRGL